jgi:predicted amidohydrolase
MRSGRDPLANRDAAVALVREAADAGADFVQTPEMTSLVDRDRTALFDKIAPEERDLTLTGLREVARERRAMVHIGSLAVRSGDKVANRGFLIDRNGDIVARYDKVHLFDVDLPNGESWRESATYAGGDKAVLAETPWGLLGLTICYDVRFPALYRALAEAGASFLTAPACFTRQTGEAHWHVLQRARAIETGSFMISAAQARPARGRAGDVRAFDDRRPLGARPRRIRRGARHRARPGRPRARGGRARPHPGSQEPARLLCLRPGRGRRATPCRCRVGRVTVREALT